MNRFEPRQSQHNLEPEEGWVVQVYGRNRRLLWVFEPVHGWIFLMGCGVGLLLAILWINLAPPNVSSDNVSSEPNPSTMDLPPLQVD